MCLLFMLLPFNAFHHQERAGTIHLLREAATKKGVKVRILTPEDELRRHLSGVEDWFAVFC